MADGPAAREEPVVRAVADHIHVRGRRLAAELRPALRDDAARAGLRQGREDGPADGGGILDHGGSEADVDRRRSGGEEVEQLARRLVDVRLVVEDEVRQVDVRAPVRRLGHQPGRPQIGEGDLIVVQQRRLPSASVSGASPSVLLAEVVDQIADAAPDEQVSHSIRQVVRTGRCSPGGMRANGWGNALVGRPRHGEDHVQRNVQRLRAVDVSVARRIGDDAVGAKGRRVGPLGIRLRAGAPGRCQNLGDHRPLLRHILDDMIEARRNDAAAGLHHVLDQRVRIAGERIELEPGLLDQRTELAVRRDAHAVPSL